MSLFIFLIAPFVALIVFLQVVRGLTTIRTGTVRWRGVKTRHESPATFWLLVAWNLAVTAAILFIYGRMVLQEFG